MRTAGSGGTANDIMTDQQGKTPTGAPEQIDLRADLGFGRTLLQFFIIPAFVVAICVGLFFFFAWLISDEKTGVDYLNEVRVGSQNRRWQAAFELSKIITAESEKSRMEGLVPEMVNAFEAATDDDPRVRHYLALSLGHLGDPAASPALIDALSDSDPTTRLYASWALGNIGASSAVEPLIARAGDDDPGVRKMAVYALGNIGDREAIPRLQAALADPDRDVSWNAAVALAQLGDGAGESQLLQMLDREFLERIEEMGESQRLLAMESAIKASALVGSDRLVEKLRGLSESDPHLGIRRAAVEALAGLGTGEDASKP